jgi:hypothetical protein
MDLEKIPLAQRKPLRITTTFPAPVAAWVFQQATAQGRSVSNLIAHLVETAMRRALMNQKLNDR